MLSLHARLIPFTPPVAAAGSDAARFSSPTASGSLLFTYDVHCLVDRSATHPPSCSVLPPVHVDRLLAAISINVPLLKETAPTDIGHTGQAGTPADQRPAGGPSYRYFSDRTKMFHSAPVAVHNGLAQRAPCPLSSDGQRRIDGQTRRRRCRTKSAAKPTH